MTNRTEILLSYVQKEGRGLEIGPSHRPTAPKAGGYRVEVVDYASQEDLKKHYAAHGVNIDAIEPVDYIWKGQKLSDVVPGREIYDWIVASHVIEHLPDLIQFFVCCAKLLKPDGRLILAVPDSRYCFDHFRPLSSLAGLIDAHLQKHRIHTAGTAAEYFLNVVSRGGKIAWDENETGDFHFVHTLQDAKLAMRAIEVDGAYLDLHAWKFVPSSFRLLVADLRALGLIELAEEHFYGAQGHEFFCTLKKGVAVNPIDRMALVQRSTEELQIGYSLLQPEVAPVRERRKTFLAWIKAIAMPRRLPSA